MLRNKTKITLGLVLLFWGLVSCQSGARQSPLNSTPMPPLFIPPTQIPATETSHPTETAQPSDPTSNDLITTEIPECINDLTFLQDLTIPDGTVVEPQTEVEKRWEVQNSGTCNWGEDYKLHFIAGDQLGVEQIQILPPTIANSKTTIQITFTAPEEPGTYFSTWQAKSPAGVPFGDEIYLYIVVE